MSFAPNFLCSGLLLSTSQNLHERSRKDLGKIRTKEELTINFSDQKEDKK